MKHKAILRKALAAAVRALERTAARGDAPNAEETALDAAKRALAATVEPEKTAANRLRALRLPSWTVRYSQTKGHEGDIVQTVYSAAGKPVCRVLPCRNPGETEKRVRMLAAAPDMLSALVDACGYMRGAGDCPFPSCDQCRIGAIIRDLNVKKPI